MFFFTCNSSGARSIIYGRTTEHVKEMTVALANGEVVTGRDLPPAELERAAAQDTLEGRAIRRVRELVHAHRDEILQRYPKILRRVAGYALDEFVELGARSTSPGSWSAPKGHWRRR